MTEPYGDSFAQELGKRYHLAVATTALLTAIPKGDRPDNIACVIAAVNGSPQFAMWNKDSIVPPDGVNTFVPDDVAALSGYDPAVTPGRWQIFTSSSGATTFKPPVRVATAAALPAYTRVGNVLTANVHATLNTAGIDGLTDLAAGQRVLVKDGAAGADNGEYDITVLGSGSIFWVLTRSSDADTSAKVVSGDQVFVSEGTANGGKSFVLTTANPIVLNSTSLTYALAVTTAPDATTGVKGIVKLAGDLGGTALLPNVLKVNGASVPAAGSLTTGNAPYVSGGSALTYSALNLAGGAGWVSGKLPLANTTMQSGTSTLSTGGTVTIAATITANSRIGVTMKDPGAGAITGFAALSVPVAARVVGAPGSFDVTAIDDSKAAISAARCTFDWFVEG